MLGGPEILLVGFISLLFVGPRRLPELAKGLGKSIRDFRHAVEGEGVESPSLPVSSAATGETKPSG